ncbi:DUF1003 domain-containing protein [Rhodococcus sp. 14-2483-1-1]|uniref:DUF1003 domain-containing protein n=1 Tax=Nocardiaceae TaxID=85025 RepID=UPI00068DD6B7|nr:MULTISPECIES: DUF1003 domain-containing protein [Rhodococcus]OZF33989.1 DUF1003 domain-containing protein [Rhodococcus sp. 14-2483-1-1]QII03530.1 DUF1003 domain-containing protein [Rhodococcus fascians A21d2]
MDTPRGSRMFNVNLDFDLGKSGEKAARFLGTGRYLAIQTGIVIVWIFLNVVAVNLQWDPYPFILLNLAFSTQAAYAAPLILLAQNRQDDRDRVSLEEDRSRAQQTKADTEFLARELAALRIAVGEVATRDYLRRELDEIKALLEHATGQPVTSPKKARKKAAARVQDDAGAPDAPDNDPAP